MKPKLLAATCILAITWELTFAAPPLAYSKRVSPIYPRSALMLGIHGTVQVGLVIAEDGSVESASVEKSSGYGELDDAALTAAKLSTFVPPRDESGKAYKAKVLVPFKFAQSDEVAPPTLVPEKTSEQYSFFLNATLPTLRCSEVVKEALRFHKTKPSATFIEMPLFQATNDLLIQRSPRKELAPSQYTSALLACTKNEGLTYITIVNDLLQ